MSDTEPKAPRRMPGARRARLALAVAPDHLTVVRLARGVAGVRPVEVLQCALAPPGTSSWPALEDALRELADVLGVSGGSVDAALLRRLGHGKVIALPPVRRAELSALVRRNAHRHFAVRDEPLVADAARLPGSRTGALVPTLAGCAPAALVEAVTAACRAAGFRIGRIVPGGVALAEGARALAPAARRGRVAVIGCAPDAVDLVQVEDGIPRLFQPLASATRVGDALRALEADGAALTGIAVCGSGPQADGVRMALLEDPEFGTRLLRAGAVERVPAEAVAALGAARAGARAPVLLPDAVRAQRAKAARRRTAVLSAAAGVMLLLSAWLHLQGIQRESEAVAARRREIAPRVASALQARNNVESVRARLVSIAALEGGAQGWTREIAALARALPDSAHLRTLAADSDGVRLAGVARSASAVVPALEASPAFARVSLAAPVRWEQGDAGERFDVAALLQRARANDRRPR
ncbi:PilN domain-containing protein [Longimicrobium sp.]|uniref:PilN domain-containing protein n=1 Tax=Longimicrobium sp. TaxID=2029185 RepID=UPI003B3AF390